MITDGVKYQKFIPSFPVCQSVSVPVIFAGTFFLPLLA